MSLIVFAGIHFAGDTELAYACPVNFRCRWCQAFLKSGHTHSRESCTIYVPATK